MDLIYQINNTCILFWSCKNVLENVVYKPRIQEGTGTIWPKNFFKRCSLNYMYTPIFWIVNIISPSFDSIKNTTGGVFDFVVYPFFVAPFLPFEQRKTNKNKIFYLRPFSYRSTRKFNSSLINYKYLISSNKKYNYSDKLNALK